MDGCAQASNRQSQPPPSPLSMPFLHRTYTLTHPLLTMNTHQTCTHTQFCHLWSGFVLPRRNHGKSHLFISHSLHHHRRPSLTQLSPLPSPESSQPFVKVLKNKQYFKRYQTKFRRRRGTWDGRNRGSSGVGGGRAKCLMRED